MSVTEMPPAKPPLRIGELLRSKGLVSEETLRRALGEQKRVGDPVGEILAGQGHLRYLDLYRLLAGQQQREFANLLDTPPENGLLDAGHWRDYIRWRCIPWKRGEDGGLVLACSEVSAALETFARQRYGEKVRFALTSPYDLQWALEKALGTDIDDRARNHLFDVAPLCSARPNPSRKTALMVLTGFSVLGLVATLWPLLVLPVLLVLCNLFYLASLLFKLVLFTESMRYGRVPTSPMLLASADPAALPVYTLLVPLYHEENAIPRLLRALDGLDYPKSKLDVKLIVEADDAGTIRAIKAARPPAYCDMIRTPYSLPRTKPKACNYALSFAQGEFVTIYDAEDLPDCDQLRKAVALFRSVPDNVVCLQARLNYYNRKENLLTALFAIEYAGLFDFMLPGLAVLGIPIPLGGTSNHFRLHVLRDLGEWDPYNVTEDADLGIRLAATGYRTLPFDSLTQEEAPLSLGAWMKQRGRWIKGYMLTWGVAMRRAGTLYRAFGPLGFAGFQLFVGASSFVYLAAPVLWTLTALWMLGISDVAWIPLWVAAMSAAIFGVGLVIQLILAIVVVRSRHWTNMWPAVLFFPFYWFLHSFASLRALWQLFTAPFHWDKTEHGISRMIPGE